MPISLSAPRSIGSTSTLPREVDLTLAQLDLLLFLLCLSRWWPALTDDVDSEFLTDLDKKKEVRSVVGSLLRGSRPSQSLWMKVPLKFLTSLMKIYTQTLNMPFKKRGTQ
jgi:hypothetical protein